MRGRTNWFLDPACSGLACRQSRGVCKSWEARKWCSTGAAAALQGGRFGRSPSKKRRVKSAGPGTGARLVVISVAAFVDGSIPPKVASDRNTHAPIHSPSSNRESSLS